MVTRSSVPNLLLIRVNRENLGPALGEAKVASGEGIAEKTLTQSLSLAALPWQRRLYTNQIAMASSSRLGILMLRFLSAGQLGMKRCGQRGLISAGPHTPQN
ncbi:hypothetical protein RRG08_035851 [Elysia crispata]|uniref:Uncharacterized protein n=1 Tax=Elysia crispata TaxID=231223 RepID=A0AAE1DA69_9GAST|nr:hypothetical protein RRG08_035851 [Elysia crispata]